MLGRTNTGGGGGGGLNFTVVGGTSAPSNPKENTIWVNTSTEITSYVFSATQPTGAAGMVWIKTGVESGVEFNALKKNGIQVYPLSAKQYVNGAWVNKTAKSYQGGKWVNWLMYLYNNGDECKSVTGGWSAKAWAATSGATGTTPTVTKGTDSITLNFSAKTATRSGCVHILNDIDITPFSTIKLKIRSMTAGGTFQTGHYCAMGLSVIPRSATYFETDAVASARASYSKSGTYTGLTVNVDVSKITGKYDICLFIIAHALDGAITATATEIQCCP